MAQNVKIIPPNVIVSDAGKTPVWRKVAGYARVSTAMDAQKSSYETQVRYYTDYIRSRTDWQFAGIYTDEGISATSTRHRTGFREMISDAVAGKLDLIITKSVSRFARNTVDTLTTIRTLKSHGVEVYFEKENIWTFDAKGELLLTIMSSMAQEESRSISENVRWGIRKSFSDGSFGLNYSHFLGYDRGEDGRPAVNPAQAEVVRRIFRMFLDGCSPYRIAKTLTEEGVPSPAGKPRWHESAVRRILTNETYTGDKLLQKTYSEDFLSRKRIRNTGQVQQYYVEGSHEAIIDFESFHMAQNELKRRSEAFQKTHIK